MVKFINSSSHLQQLILVVVNLELFQETRGAIHTQIYAKLAQPILILACVLEGGENQSIQRKPTQNYGEQISAKFHYDSNLSS